MTTTLTALAAAPYERQALLTALARAITPLRFTPADQRRLLQACADLADALDDCAGDTLQERWTNFEQTHWRRWLAGEHRPSPNRWTWGARVLVLARLVRPSWAWLADVHLAKWVARLPPDDPLQQQRTPLAEAITALPWRPHPRLQDWAVSTGLRILLVHGYTTLQEITDADLAAIPRQWSKGSDVLDAALCALGVFTRTPQRGASRRNRRGRRTPAELVALADMPDRFRAVTILYLETYATRISSVYATLRHKLIALGHFWRFLDARYPEVESCAAVLPAHARAYIPYARERARLVQRGGAKGTEERGTAHVWLIEVRTFFADLCTWATEPDSPFAGLAPATIPLTRHDLVGVGFEKARQRAAARMTATVLDLERELPRIRAFALQCWTTAEEALKATPTDTRLQAAEAVAFWDWGLLELLVQSGLRIEEASELTTLDILKRRLPDGRLYYLLHIKPSKYDRARVIPIGDGLGRVLAEMLRHIKRFYGSTTVPFCDHWDQHEKQARPRAPYLLQAAKHPSAIGIQTIRGRLRSLSLAAGAQRSDGTPLVLLPHDCRRVFASEHLNNNTPVHVIQALLGHATLDTVMVYAKLYPAHLVEEYRKTVRGLYNAVHGEDSLRNPTGEEWAAFAAQCSLRDMGTHLCALPTGEHCPRGLVCLGCVHAQPKQSAVPVFRRMLASHERALAAARERGEPAGQLAARELEVMRIGSALRRAEELPRDVAAAIEAAAGSEEVS
jgi:integrase